MDQNDAPIGPETLADRAFDDLRGEVGLLRRAIEQLVSERQNNDNPDYTPTLTVTAARLDEIAQFMGAVARSPAMRLTPESVARQIEAGMETVRAGERETLERTSAALRASVTSIDGIVEQAWAADRQNRWLLGTGLVGALAGMLLWSTLSGEVARALPASWNVPERMAARTLRLDFREAGQRLTAVAQSRVAETKNGERHAPNASSLGKQNETRESAHD